jgi:hypothetical protein
LDDLFEDRIEKCIRICPNSGPSDIVLFVSLYARNITIIIIIMFFPLSNTKFHASAKEYIKIIMESNVLIFIDQYICLLIFIDFV